AWMYMPRQQEKEKKTREKRRRRKNSIDSAPSELSDLGKKIYPSLAPVVFLLRPPPSHLHPSHNPPASSPLIPLHSAPGAPAASGRRYDVVFHPHVSHSTPRKVPLLPPVKMMRCAVRGGGAHVVIGERRSPSSSSPGSGRSVVRMSEGRGGLCCGGVRSRAADLAGLEMGRPSAGAAGLFRSTRYGRVRATASGACVAVSSLPSRVADSGHGSVVVQSGVWLLGMM
uniref:Uncharacterized protein n=1 Tax=Aegilops tauschii subsp. strangulata TaxID=200361 RepID=A0A453DU78_AEGTS